MKLLPIEQVLPELKQALERSPAAVLVAPPGAGKTTRVPLALLEQEWLAGQRLLLLEPRRLAARAVARFMAHQLGEQVGQTVGYRVKMDTRVGPDTRIEVITEGVLTRMLQQDPALEGVGLVLFDEFHERSLQADLGLALCRQSQSVLREDLKLLVMSATLEAEPVAALLDQAPIIRSEGRAFPVDTVYLQRPSSGPIESAVAGCVRQALQQQEGDVLVFLPGAAEIRKTARLLEDMKLGPGFRIAPLYGDLAQSAQDQALAPAEPGIRKIVLATSIAETSLTVEGVRVVIDSGLMRVPRFSPRTGMSRLETAPVSVASADQRRGRAGRLAPGVCYRMWTEQAHRQLSESRIPEIMEADLAPLALELAAWGVREPAELSWLDAPPEAAYRQARQLLVQLGALNGEGAITPHGRRMAELGAHPRLAHMMLCASPLGLGATACELAALLQEKDVLRGEAARDCDVRTRVELVRSCRAPRPEPAGRAAAAAGLQADHALCKRIAATAAAWIRALGIRPGAEDRAAACGLLLAWAFPDRIAQLRTTGRFLLSSGRGAVLPELQSLSQERFLVAAELDDQGPESRIFLAAPVDIDELQKHMPQLLTEEQHVGWDEEAQAVRARLRLRLGALLLRDIPAHKPDAVLIARTLIDRIVKAGLEPLPWTRASRQLQQRVCLLHRMLPDWPDYSDAALAERAEEWLAPYLHGLRSLIDLQRLRMTDMLTEGLTWQQRRLLEEWAPTHIRVPSGSLIPIDYADPQAPTLSVRLQEMFGLRETPRIANGTLPLTLHLLSPAQRPVQVTRDLASFWQNAYFEVKKDLKGRYPKHYWPDDPLAAPPTSRAKPRS